MEDKLQLGGQIVWVKLGNQDLYIDPASKFYGYPNLPWFETGTNGIRVDKQGGTNITIPLSPATDSFASATPTSNSKTMAPSPASLKSLTSANGVP